jgi:hypothetical protein
MMVAAVAIIGVTVVYGISEWMLHRPYDAPLSRLRVAAAPDLIEGERMARIVRLLGRLPRPHRTGRARRNSGNHPSHSAHAFAGDAAVQR